MKPNWNKLNKLFLEQYGELPIGGWLNPTLEYVENGVMGFRCFYDGFDNDDDCWHYTFDVQAQQFS